MSNLKITSSSYKGLTKKELIEAIDKLFPDDNHAQIAVVTTTLARDRANDDVKVINQSITLADHLEV